GLPAQERLVFLLRPQGRSQPQVTEPYSIEAGEETILRDVALEEASRIFVDVTVPKSVADVVELHSVTLHPVDDNHWPRHLPLQAVIAGNRAAIDDVPPGTWEVRATGRLVNGFALKLAAEKIDVSPGSERYVVLTVADALYRGRVTRAGAPVRGTLNLRPVSAGEPAVAKLDAEGEFRVLLASPGEYVATVQDAEKHMVKLRDRVRFSDASTRVEITLPLGTIAGRVVDSAGVPVAGVFVNAREQAQDGGGESSARAAADGSFVVKSTYAGKWELVAESTRQRSEPEVVFASDGAVEGVTLVVDDTRVVNIEVVDSTGTLMRFASVDAEFAVAGSAQPQTFGMRTGRDGRVTLRLTDAQRAAPANLVVRDLPGGVLSCELRRLNADQTVRVPALTGELRLIAPRWIATVARNWLVSASGCAVPFFAHVERERSGGEAMVFARLRTGTWRYVQTRAPEELRLVLTGRGQLLPAIATFTVDPLKTTRVNVNP
nr:carboxypeptidase-like regulatory domain-containing protein [Acidobacteriota bacterium]